MKWNASVRRHWSLASTQLLVLFLLSRSCSACPAPHYHVLLRASLLLFGWRSLIHGLNGAFYWSVHPHLRYKIQAKPIIPFLPGIGGSSPGTQGLTFLSVPAAWIPRAALILALSEAGLLGRWLDSLKCPRLDSLKCPRSFQRFLSLPVLTKGWLSHFQSKGTGIIWKHMKGR